MFAIKFVFDKKFRLGVMFYDVFIAYDVTQLSTVAYMVVVVPLEMIPLCRP